MVQHSFHVQCSTLILSLHGPPCVTVSNVSIRYQEFFLSCHDVVCSGIHGVGTLSLSISSASVLEGNTRIIQTLGGQCSLVHDRQPPSVVLEWDYVFVTSSSRILFPPTASHPINFSLLIRRGEWMIDQSTLQLTSLQLHSPSLKGSIHSAELKTNGNPFLALDTIQGSDSHLSVSSVSLHYSPDLFDETVRSLLSLLVRLPPSIRLQWSYAFLAKSRHWKANPLSSLSFPPFLESVQPDNPTFTVSVSRCSLLLLDASHSFLIQSSLHVLLSPSVFGIELLRPTIHSEQDLILKVDRASFVGHCASNQRYLDLSFSRVRVSLSPECIARLFQIVRSVTFSIWCCLFDVVSTINTGAITSARQLNEQFQDVSARNGHLQPPCTCRNRPYSDRSEYMRLRSWFQQTLSSEEEMIQRLLVTDTELRLNCNNRSVCIRVNRWGAESLPSIDFYAKTTTITSPGFVVHLYNCSFKECLHSQSLRSIWNKDLPRTKSVFGVLAWEVILRGLQCGDAMNCTG